MNNSFKYALDKENDLWLGPDNGIVHLRSILLFLFYDSSEFWFRLLCNKYSKWLFNGLKSWYYKYVDKQLSLLPDTQGKPGILVNIVLM
jgi:hypothetical protein